MSRATGQTYYIVENDSFGAEPRYRVVRINPIGQGWVVTKYYSANTAARVAGFLNDRVDEETS